MMKSYLQLIDSSVDSSNMAEVIRRLPRQIEIAIQQQLPVIGKDLFKRVVIAGVGGSALPAEIMMDAFGNDIQVPVMVLRHYSHPGLITEESLVVASSFSGNTEEVLSVVQGLPKGAPNVVIISAGGQLTSLAHEKGYSLIQVPGHLEPPGFQPRSAIGYFATFFARTLFSAGLMRHNPQTGLENVVRFLDGMDVQQDAWEVANWLKPRIPVIYADELHHMSIARVAKIKFNENSKRPAFFNALPEANHNEMVGFLNKALGDFGILFFHDPESHPRVQQRFDTMKKVFEEERLDHVSFRKWQIPGNTRVEKIFAAMSFADWCSYLLALLDGIDPTPVALVEKFKRMLT